MIDHVSNTTNEDSFVLWKVKYHDVFFFKWRPNKSFISHLNWFFSQICCYGRGSSTLGILSLQDYYSGNTDLLEKYKVVVGGDQLTRVRLQGAKLLRVHAPDIKARFGHLGTFVIEHWHNKQDITHVRLVRFLFFIWFHFFVQICLFLNFYRLVNSL